MSDAMRRMREGAELTQEAAAAKLEVSVYTVKNWDAGKYPPPLSRYPDIAEAFGCSVADVQDAVREIESALLNKRVHQHPRAG